MNRTNKADWKAHKTKKSKDRARYLVKASINYSKNSRYIKQKDLTQSHHAS